LFCCNNFESGCFGNSKDPNRLLENGMNSIVRFEIHRLRFQKHFAMVEQHC
jgi:hypothetical protein